MVEGVVPAVLAGEHRTVEGRNGLVDAREALAIDTGSSLAEGEEIAVVNGMARRHRGTAAGIARELAR